jgi:hypothetical protein
MRRFEETEKEVLRKYFSIGQVSSSLAQSFFASYTRSFWEIGPLLRDSHFVILVDFGNRKLSLFSMLSAIALLIFSSFFNPPSTCCTSPPLGVLLTMPLRPVGVRRFSEARR